jgi:hypothetical protein
MASKRSVPAARQFIAQPRCPLLGALLWWLTMTASQGFAGAIHPTVAAEHATVEPGESGSLRVLLMPEGTPGLLFKPVQGAWDWSLTSKLVIPVDNPGDEPLDLHLRIESSADVTQARLTGAMAIAPKSGGNLTLWLAAPSPRSMGMLAGPSLAVAGLEPNTLPVTATNGSVDASHIAAIRLWVSRPPVPAPLIVGLPRVTPPNTEEKKVYACVGVVNKFGQFRPGHWPEKVSSVAMLRAGAAAEARSLAWQPAGMAQRDRFGGLPGAGRFRAIGFFRTERRDGRWWLVTPEGHGFFSIGMDVVEPAGATYVEGREFMFHDLPARDGPLAGHWGEDDDRRDVWEQPGRRFDHGYTFDFYTANLARKFGADWRSRWRDEALARLPAWGFNTIGNWSASDLWAAHRLPYTVPLYPNGNYATIISGEAAWGPMPDPFDPRFAAAVDEMARDAAARFGGDPYLIGYFVHNELPWGVGRSQDVRWRYSTALGALAAGPESPAKAALRAQLVRTYHEPSQLARAWGIALKSWDELRRTGFTLPQASLDRPAVKEDLAIFSRAFAEAYFRTVSEALHQHDPHHLYLGSRFAAGYTPEAVAACARWCHVVSFNIYRRSIADDRAQWAQFHKLGKPALIGEFSFGSDNRGLFSVLDNQKESERGPAYARYLADAADNPDFVGAHWFEYVDEPLTGRTLDGENGHFGFVTVADMPYRGLAAAARAANAAVLQRLVRSAAASE